MPSLRARAAEGLRVGDTFTTVRTFTEDDVAHFARLSGDYNPVHFDASFAQARGFRGKIAHGLLSAGLVTEIGGQIGWVASSMNFRFKGPVYLGEPITCAWVITEIDERGRAKASARITRPDGVTVIEADIGGVVPGPDARELLRRMLADGDPTNGPHHTRMVSAA